MSVTTEQVVETLASSPSIEDLKRATRLSLPDLIRFGSTATDQAHSTFGQGGEACAMSAAALALEALEAK